MDRIKNYILQNLWMLFISIFTPLFAIASVIFLIKLATYTAIIKLTAWEMTQLYLFVLPELLFYTLPVSFFIASTLALLRLSNENELVVLFALGIAPKFLLKTLLPPALLLSALLFFNFFFLFPHTTTLSKNFISYKKSEAKFNLSASEFGHKFGDWLLYIGKNLSDGYGDVFLFNKNAKEEVLISAKKAQVLNEAGVLRLRLTTGEAYSYSKEKFSQINFEEMYINDTLVTNIEHHPTTLEYWFGSKKASFKKKSLITNTLLSLFPLITLSFVLTLGVVHARHHKSRVYLYLFMIVLCYYGATIGLEPLIGYLSVPFVALTFGLMGFMLYRKNIVARF